MSRIFLSYRRSDSQNVADRIYDYLVQEFGSEDVFKDVDSIPLGADFRRVIEESVIRTEVLVAVIGPNWVDATDRMGNRRLDNPDDFVRIEIETALAHPITVVPITVESTAMPSASDLPENMRAITSRQGLVVRADPDFRNDVARLIRSIHTLRGSVPSSEGDSGQNGEFVEVLKHRSEMVLAYILEQRDAALYCFKHEPEESRWEIERWYDNATESFKTLHSQYLEAINANKSQVAHEIIGELYRLVYSCQHTRVTPPPEPPPPMLCRD